MGPLSEEQSEFVGYCRHCELELYRIDGQMFEGFSCKMNLIHQVERRKDFATRKQVKGVIAELLGLIRRN